MAVFDVNTFLQMTGNGAGGLQAFGTSFGMPSCMLNLTDAALQLIPSPILNKIRGSTQAGSNRADDVIKAAFRKLRWLTGIIEVDTEDGIYRFVSDTSKNGIDNDENGFLNTIGSVVGALGSAAGFAGRLYTNYQNVAGQVNSIKDCLEGYINYLKLNGSIARQQLDPSAYADYIDTEFGAERDALDAAFTFIDQANSLINSIDSTLTARRADPSLEPTFTCDYQYLLSGTNVRVACPTVSATEVFRLDFGPPKSSNGRFLLSVDGLYFDSQVSGIIPALLEITSKAQKLVTADKWKFEHAPNIGGKGKGLGTNDLNLYVNTILDPDKIDDSRYLKNHYDADVFLNDIIGQKNKRLYDLSSQIVELENGNASEAIISNLRQAMFSENSKFIQKVNKRKKQIELALKMPYIYGKNINYALGEIPINDFSYLEGINFLVDIQKQKSMLLKQDDVSGVVLPLKSVFVTKKTSGNNVSLDHLLLAEDGAGTILYDSSSVSSIDPINYSMTETVVTDGLFAIYNYLQTNVLPPSSTEMNLYNGIQGREDNNALIVAQDPREIFGNGLGIPYLHGITKHSQTTPTEISALGSFVKLPETKDFNDFLYNRKGATFETWLHVPNIDNLTSGFGIGNVSGLYRIILGNENTGLKENASAQSDILFVPKDKSDNIVKGMLMGFTSDRRITSNQAPSNIISSNPASSISFFIAPTQSFDSSSVAFINKSYAANDTCNSQYSWHNFKINIRDTINGKAFSSVGSDVMHLSVVFDVPSNELKVYLDGALMGTSAISEVFNVNPGFSINLPSFKRNNSFTYNSTNVNTGAPESLKAGPRLGRYFTPWILGGGFTDGLYNKGNFMGGEYGGLISGLKGYLGSTKFYNKPLTQTEVLRNFNSQKNFFKNIYAPDLAWEPAPGE